MCFEFGIYCDRVGAKAVQQFVVKRPGNDCSGKQSVLQIFFQTQVFRLVRAGFADRVVGKRILRMLFMIKFDRVFDCAPQRVVLDLHAHFGRLDHKSIAEAVRRSR